MILFYQRKLSTNISSLNGSTHQTSTQLLKIRKVTKSRQTNNSKDLMRNLKFHVLFTEAGFAYLHLGDLAHSKN